MWNAKNEEQEKARRHWVSGAFLSVLCLWGISQAQLVPAAPTEGHPIVIDTEKKEIQLYGVIYPERFNAAQGEQAHYHLLVWHKGKSPHALIETPADDLDFHAALVQLGAAPGDNLSMTAWTERKDDHSTAAHQKVTGDSLDIRIAWKGKSDSMPISQLFQQTGRPENSELRTSNSEPSWRFGGNRDRPFNRFPLLSRPGCLVCLYSCPSGKVSNAALSIHEYVAFPSHFVANTTLLPPDGTPVILTFRPLSHEDHHE